MAAPPPCAGDRPRGNLAATPRVIAVTAAARRANHLTAPHGSTHPGSAHQPVSRSRGMGDASEENNDSPVLPPPPKPKTSLLDMIGQAKAKATDTVESNDKDKEEENKKMGRVRRKSRDLGASASTMPPDSARSHTRVHARVPRTGQPLTSLWSHVVQIWINLACGERISRT